jgi:hypothetical protein
MSPSPEGSQGWGPVPVTEWTEWTESRNWTESTEADEAKRSPLLRRGGDGVPDNQSNHA